MAKAATHYLPNGKVYIGPTHKMGGELHTGKTHSPSSQKLSHKKPRMKLK